MRLALAQIQSGTDPTANLGLVEDFTRRAAEAGARIVLFPEATMCRFGVPLKPIAEPLDGPWASGVREIAGRFDIVVVAGMFCPSEHEGDGRVTNTLVATGPGVEEHYHKIHLYDAFGFTESRTVAPGFDLAVITVAGVDIGLTTCYDIRFPDLFVALAQRGAQLITVHASWGSGPGKLEQWTLLTRARALDSACIVAAVGQAHPSDQIAAAGPTGVGGSLVATPVGDVVAAAGADPRLLIVDVDLETVAAARDTIAVLRNHAELSQSGRAQSQA